MTYSGNVFTLLIFLIAIIIFYKRKLISSNICIVVFAFVLITFCFPIKENLNNKALRDMALASLDNGGGGGGGGGGGEKGAF